MKKSLFFFAKFPLKSYCNNTTQDKSQEILVQVTVKIENKLKLKANKYKKIQPKRSTIAMSKNAKKNC